MKHYFHTVYVKEFFYIGFFCLTAKLFFRKLTSPTFSLIFKFLKLVIEKRFHTDYNTTKPVY